MMVSVNAVKNGMYRWIDNELAPSMSGWQKVVVSTAAGVCVQRLDCKLEELPLGLYDNGMVDVDLIYSEARKRMNEPISIDIPMVGTIMLTQNNLDQLYNYIIQG